jgi:hypothetical protein
MSLKRTLIFGVFFAALLGFIFLFEEPKEKSLLQAGKIVPDMEEIYLTELSIKNSSGELKLLRAGGGWRTDDLGYSVADAASADQVVTNLKAFEITNSISPEEVENSLAIYGLDKPEVTVGYKYKEELNSVAFGKKNEFTGRRYAQIAGRPGVYFVTEELYSSALKPISDFRDQTPIQFDNTEIGSIKIKSTKRDYEFKVEDGMWKAVKPYKASLANSLVGELLINLRGIKAQNIINPTSDKPLQMSKYGLDKPIGTLEIGFRVNDKKPIVIQFGSVDAGKGLDNMSVSAFDAVFTVDESNLGKLFKDVETFRENNPFSFSKDFVEEVVISMADKESVIITKSKDENGATWLVNSNKGEVAFVENLLQEISQAKAENYILESLNFGFDKPALKIAVKLGVGADKEKLLLVGKKHVQGGVTKGYFAAIEDLSEPFIISEQTLRRITPNLEVLLPLKENKENADKEKK